MAYVSTYVCDFVDFDPPPYDRKGMPCRKLAETACAICEKHGCYEHLKRGIRVVFAPCERAFKQPDLPMRGIDPLSVAAGVLTFAQFQELSLEVKTAATHDSDQRASTERAVCANCLRLFTRANPDVREPLQAAINGFVVAVRASLAEAAMEAKKEAIG